MHCLSRENARGLNGPLRVLAYLLEAGESTLLSISRGTNLNYRTVMRAVDILKKYGFVEENYDPGPPARRLIKLTEKGRQAAQHAKELLRLAEIL